MDDEAVKKIFDRERFRTLLLETLEIKEVIDSEDLLDFAYVTFKHGLEAGLLIADPHRARAAMNGGKVEIH